MRFGRLVFCLLVLSGCRGGVYPWTELVIPDRATVSALTPNGPIQVTAIPASWRRYSWEGGGASVLLFPTRERVDGQLGITNGGAFFFPQQDGAFKANVQEAQLHFSTRGEAERFLARQRTLDSRAVWNNSGLVVEFAIVGPILEVNVYQICIADHKPAGLRGAEDRAITLDDSGGSAVPTIPCRRATAAAVVPWYYYDRESVYLELDGNDVTYNNGRDGFDWFQHLKMEQPQRGIFGNVIVQHTDGTYTVEDAGGQIYQFNQQGRLVRAAAIPGKR